MTARPLPPRRRRRLAGRAMLAALLLLAGLAAGHALLWQWMGGQLEAGFEAWARARRAQGWRVEHGPPVRGGWPFAATLALPDFRLQGGGATLPGGLDWQAGTLVLRLAPPRLEQLVVRMPGPHRLRLAGGEIPFTADRLDLLLPLERGVLPREAEVAAERLRLGTAAGPVDLRHAEARIETRTTAIEGEPAVTLALGAEGVDLPPGAVPAAGGGLGRRIEGASAELVLSGPIPAGRDPVQRAETWREAGGTLEVRGAQLRWGPLSGGGAATLTLDDALQPMGAGTLRLSNMGAALDALAAGGAIGPRAAASAKAVLALMARTPPEGGAPVVEVPFTLEDRTLAVARFRVVRFGPIDWPEAGVGGGRGAVGGAAEPSLPASR